MTDAKADKVTIERGETTYTHAEVRKMLDGISADAHRHGLEVVDNLDGTMGLRAALAAQPATVQPVEPVATSYADHQQRIGAPLTFFTSVAAQAYRAAATRDDVTHEDAMRVALQAVQGAAPPAPAAVPLTVSEIERMWSDAIMNGADGAILFARAIERAHGIAAAGDKP